MSMERWWISMGYPEFEAGEDGFPRPGQVTKHYRYLKKRGDGQPWTQRDLAYVLGISENEVRNMENRDRGFSLERRRFLAHLLNIPPILLGVVTLEQIEQMLAQQQAALPTRAIASTKRVMVDLEQCRQALTGYWEANHAHSAQQAIPDMRNWIALLNDELPFVTGKEKRERYELLISYHRLIANILRDYLSFDDAVAHLNIALELAKVGESKELQALILHSRALTLQEQGNLDAARVDGAQALSLVRSHPASPLYGTIALEAGHIQAKTARDEADRTKALKTIDEAESLARAGYSEDLHFLKLDEVRYHLSRGSALIAIGWNKDAITELSMVEDNPAALRRSAYRDILLAQAYASKGDYAYAAALAAPALQTVKEINSQVNITRVAALYARLKNSPFKNDPEVERLAWLLYPR